MHYGRVRAVAVNTHLCVAASLADRLQVRPRSVLGPYEVRTRSVLGPSAGQSQLFSLCLSACLQCLPSRPIGLSGSARVTKLTPWGGRKVRSLVDFDPWICNS
jgi:hypothetical protein